MEQKNQNFINYFTDRHSFTTDDIDRFFHATKPDIKRSTVNWRVYELVEKGVLTRIGRGVFTLGTRQDFIIHPDNRIKQLNRLLKKQFPYASLCFWRTADFKQFSQHIPAIDFIVIEVEKETEESAYYALKESGKFVVSKPTPTVFEDFILDRADSIIVKRLMSESPIQIYDDVPVPALEKMLVDLYTEKRLFYFIEGREFKHIFRNAIEKYTINTDKLLRYAARRGKKEEFQSMLNPNYRQ